MSPNARLTLTIDDTRYSVGIGPSPDSWVLGRGDREPYYTLTRGHDPEFGPVLRCTCPDYEHRHRADGTHCKHIRAALHVGLI